VVGNGLLIVNPLQTSLQHLIDVLTAQYERTQNPLLKKEVEKYHKSLKLLCENPEQGHKCLKALLHCSLTQTLNPKNHPKE